MRLGDHQATATRQKAKKAKLTNFAERLEGDLSTWSVLLVLLAGILFGAIVLFVDAAWWDARHRDFAGEGPFVLWAGLMCAQTALWALALAWLLPSVHRLACPVRRPEPERGRPLDAHHPRDHPARRPRRPLPQPLARLCH